MPLSRLRLPLRFVCLVGLSAKLLVASATPTDKNLRFTFIGNEAFLITDGDTALFTDFPYKSGAFGYMAYDFTAVPMPEHCLCLITHGHADHFDSALFGKTNCSNIAPSSVTAGLDESRTIPFAREMTYRGITVRAFPTPHGDIEHYSYLVLWHGRRMYFAGDTDDVEELSRQSGLDLAFVTPWQLEAMQKEKLHIGARQVIIYHHKVAEDVPPFQDRSVPRQGESFELSSK